MKIFVLTFFTVFASSITCASNGTIIPLLLIENSTWTAEETTYIEELNKKGSLTIATKISSSVYMPKEDGSVAGFHYSVLKEFTDLMNIDIEIELVKWQDYFHKDGGDLERVKTDPGYSYVPTLLENVDIYVDGITVLPWREKMFDIVKYVPSRQMIVSRLESYPKTIADLNNKVCAMVKDTSMEFNLNKIIADNDLNITYLYTDDFDAMDKMVSEGLADFTVYDSDRAFVAHNHYKNLTIAMPINDVEIMGWAIHKDNRILKSVLEKYFEHAQKTKILDKYWHLSYGVTFVEYLKILQLGDNVH
jgi:membrane-bound lytic murein transglycosylase MltF